MAQANVDGYFAKIKETFGIENWDEMKDSVLALGADGASVMSGCEGGLVGKMKQEIPKVIYVHCSAHRLQLALQDAWKKIPYMSTFDTTICSIYALYHRSPKKTTQLEEMAAICNQTVNKFHTIHPVRWVASKHGATNIGQKHEANTWGQRTQQMRQLHRGCSKPYHHTDLFPFYIL